MAAVNGRIGRRASLPRTYENENVVVMKVLNCSEGETPSKDSKLVAERRARNVSEDAYFSVDVETDGPIPGPYSMLSFAIVYAGSFDGQSFVRPNDYDSVFYREMKPISDEFEQEALNVNGLDRKSLIQNGEQPSRALAEADTWIRKRSSGRSPVLIAYPLSFDWTWLYWYFVRFNHGRSPFSHSRCFDIKTAFAVKGRLPVSAAGRSEIPERFRPETKHTHHAIDDAIEQAQIFANIFEWNGA